MYLRLLTIVLAAHLLCLPEIFASDDIEWLTTTYDFGAFKEIEGPRTGTVKGVNRGDSPAMINRVRLSCGCTSESHTEDLVQPGDTAFVSFTYNPIGRPGRFQKTVKVYTGTDNRITTITMRGTVIGAPETLQTTYPFEAGPLRLSETTVDLGKVRYGTSRHHFLTAYNQTADSVRPHWNNNHDNVDFAIAEPVVAPGDLSTFSIYLNTRDLTEMGPVEYEIPLYPDTGMDNPVSITVRAEIEPDTSRLTPEEVDNGPRCSLLPRVIDLGELTGDQPVKFRFTVSNEGKSKMRVTRVNARDRRVVIKRIPVNINPGKSGEAEGTLSAGSLDEGAFRIPVEVYTDDPLHPVSVINVTGIRRK